MRNYLSLDRLWLWGIIATTAAAPLFGRLNVSIGVIIAGIALHHIYHNDRNRDAKATYVAASMLLYFGYLFMRSVLAGIDFDYDGLFVDYLIRSLPFLYIPLIALSLKITLISPTLAQVAKYSRYTILFTAPLVAIEKYAIGYSRPELYADNALILATFVLITGFMIFLDWREQSTRMKWFTLLCFAVTLWLQGFAMVSRAAILIYPIVIAAFLVISLAQSRAPLRLKLVMFTCLSAFGALALLGLAYLMRDSDIVARMVRVWHVLNDPQIAITLDISLAERIDMLQATLRALNENWLWGVGPQEVMKNITPYLNNQKISNTHVHNAMLTHLLSGGVPALLLYVNLVFSPLVIWWMSHERRATLLYLAITLVVVNFSMGMTYASYLHGVRSTYWAMMICLILAFMLWNDAEQKRALKP